jgi:hypothetical protein
MQASGFARDHQPMCEDHGYFGLARAGHIFDDEQQRTFAQVDVFGIFLEWCRLIFCAE